MIIQFILLGDYTDNLYWSLIWCPGHLNNEFFYMPVVVKKQILMSSWLPDCQFCVGTYSPLVAGIYNHSMYIYALSTPRVNDDLN